MWVNSDTDTEFEFSLLIRGLTQFGILAGVHHTLILLAPTRRLNTRQGTPLPSTEGCRPVMR
jgi:hypothetical protein